MLKEDEKIQNSSMTGFELTKLVYKSKKLTDFVKENGKKISPANIKTILANLCTFYNAEKSCIYPKIEAIMEETCLSKMTVWRVIEFLHASGLVLRQGNLNKDNRRNFYVFSGKFFELILEDNQKILEQKKVSPRYLNSKNRYHRDTYLKMAQVNQGAVDNTNFDTPINNNIKINNNKDFFQKNIFEQKKEQKNSGRIKTDFQKKFADVIEDLSDYDWAEYQKKEGFEKQEFLEGKRKEFLRAEIDLKTRQKLAQIRSEKGFSPLDFGRDDAVQFVKNMPKEVRRVSFIAKKLCQKWDFSDENLSG